MGSSGCSSLYMASFKSCPREGASGLIHTKPRQNRIVSSHAPVRGHPKDAASRIRAVRVSSHAPVRGHPTPRATSWASPVFQVMPP